MVLGAAKNIRSSQKNRSKAAQKASKIKSAEIIEDSDDEEPVGTSDKTSQEGVKGTLLSSSKASAPIESTIKRNEEGKTQDVSSPLKQSPLVQNGRLPKKPKLDISSSFDRSKASVHVEPNFLRNTAFQFGNVPPSSKKKALELDGGLPKKQKPDVSSSSDSGSKKIYSQSDGEASSNESESERSSNTGTSDGSQSETSISMGRSKESGAQPAYKESALYSQMSISRRTAPPYEPPPGFKSAPINVHPASEIAQITSPSALQGKELWHVTVPKTVPIGSITEVSTKSIFAGAAILSHDGDEYGLSPETQNNPARRIVLFPLSKTANYESAGINISKTLHLQRIIRLPNSAAVSDKPTDSTLRKYTKRINEQPPGLKMRYRPFGASSESSEKSDSEPIANEALSATRFHLPRSSIAPSSMKRKRNQNDQTDETQSPARVKRKQEPASSDVLTELEQVLDQHISPNKHLDESSEAQTPAELDTDPHHSTKSLENEPTSTSRSKSLKKPKTHHHHLHQEINSPTSLPNSSMPSKFGTSPHNSFSVPNTQSPTKLLIHSLSKSQDNTQHHPLPSPQITTSPDTKLSTEESQTFTTPLHKIQVQQHPDNNNELPTLQAPKPKSKRNETPDEKARRRAERRKHETSEDRERRIVATRERRARKEDRKRRRGE